MEAAHLTTFHTSPGSGMMSVLVCGAAALAPTACALPAEVIAKVYYTGLRDATDFDYEVGMAGMNGAMAPGIETVFLAAAPSVAVRAIDLIPRRRF